MTSSVPRVTLRQLGAIGVLLLILVPLGCRGRQQIAKPVNPEEARQTLDRAVWPTGPRGASRRRGCDNPPRS